MKREQRTLACQKRRATLARRFVFAEPPDWVERKETPPCEAGRCSDFFETGCAYALKLEPQPQVEVEFGLLNTNPEPMISSL